MVRHDGSDGRSVQAEAWNEAFSFGMIMFNSTPPDSEMRWNTFARSAMARIHTKFIQNAQIVSDPTIVSIPDQGVI